MSEGIRSIAQGWMGGSGLRLPASGVRSMQAFWMGGTAASLVVPPIPVEQVVYGGGGGRSSWEPEPGRQAAWHEFIHEKQRRYDEVFAKLLAAEQVLETARVTIAVRNKSHAYTAKERLRLRPLEEKVVKLRARLERLESDLEEEHLIIALMMQ